MKIIREPLVHFLAIDAAVFVLFGLMGLDKDDTVIRRRLAQKLEFLTQDLISPQPPTEDELRTYFKAHMDQYGIVSSTS